MTENITRPTLIVDLDKVETNIINMLDKSLKQGVQLVPHFKTHQSKLIGELFRIRGIQAITVSSVQMAEYFADAGWKDITIAFPFNRLETGAINVLVEKGVRLKLLVTDIDTVRYLSNNLMSEVDLMIEIDTGDHRSGINANDADQIIETAEKIRNADNVNLYGIYCHSGNTYHADSTSDIQMIWSSSIKKMNEVKSILIAGGNDLKIRMGDTPGCVVVEDMKDIDEIGPGNFVFFDLVMNYLDVCKEEEIAVAVACPVVAKYEDRGEIIIHGGAVHFSKDHLFDKEENKFFGEIVIIEDRGWSSILPGAKLVSVSQEHGVLRVNKEMFDAIAIGDVIGVLPIHSCLTANLMGSYTSFEGKRIDHL